MLVISAALSCVYTELTAVEFPGLLSTVNRDLDPRRDRAKGKERESEREKIPSADWPLRSLASQR